MRARATHPVVVAMMALLFVTARTDLADSQAREPVYVGVKVCAECHQGPESGHQFSLWRSSAHAKAYAALAMAESEEIARISGIPEPPHEARVCLGCHATAADTEEWERDETFHVDDGVQCEMCHGPGSEYIDPEVMADPELAMERGLRKPTADTCMICHAPKGSHEAVLTSAPWEVNEALQRIAHPRPEHPADFETESAASATAPLGTSEHRFVGARACIECHAGPDEAFQASGWRLGPHARAYATLATPEGYAIARQSGVDGNPQTSPACLRCHTTGAGHDAASFAPDFDAREGVQCESCHGAGADYAPEAVMLDPVAARGAGLRQPDAEVCLSCHEESHSGEPFDYEAARAELSHPRLPAAKIAQEPRYKTPVNLALTPDGEELWVACEASASTIVVDTGTNSKVAEIAVGGQPHDVTFTPDGATAYVTNRLDDTVSVIDVERREVVDTVAAGDEPHGILTDRSGRFLFVLNSGQDNISVLDGETLEEVKRLSASRVPWSLALSPDGETLLVTNTLSRFTEPRTPPVSEVTALSMDRAVVTERFEVPETNLLQGVAWHPDGEYALVTMNRTKNLVPMTRLLQGWTITNGIAVVWRDGRVDQLLLDGPGMAFPDAADVAITPDGRRALVTSSGSNRVAVIDLQKLVALLEAASVDERERVLPNHLGSSAQFIESFVGTGASPRGVAISRDSATAWVANALDDSVTRIDLADPATTTRIDLGGPTEISQTRWGEVLFHSANIAFRRQFSCHTCHPDGHVDGITYDIEPDGIGVDPVDNRSLRGIYDTAPFKWTGLNKTLQRQCGPRLAVFFTRLAPFAPDELAALERYITTIPRPPNRHRALGAPLTEAQRAGRKIFERAYANDGRRLEPTERCINCHPAPLYSDRRSHDVGTKTQFDRGGLFDTPHLTNIYDSAPYLHDGRARSLEEIWTRFNTYDLHGATNDLTKDQLNHLIEYLKTL